MCSLEKQLSTGNGGGNFPPLHLTLLFPFPLTLFVQKKSGRYSYRLSLQHLTSITMIKAPETDLHPTENRSNFQAAHSVYKVRLSHEAWVKCTI
ncbi:hypothetical protein XENTR_v10011974 [Xenopus tropicalis]|nr:hypothetical protein XENTR_v10011974 [Xenopus tropicalis]